MCLLKGGNSSPANVDAPVYHTSHSSLEVSDCCDRLALCETVHRDERQPVQPTPIVEKSLYIAGVLRPVRATSTDAVLKGRVRCKDRDTARHWYKEQKQRSDDHLDQSLLQHLKEQSAGDLDANVV